MKIRQSNIELLRLLAMFFVLVIHADFWALDVPTYSDLETDEGFFFLCLGISCSMYVISTNSMVQENHLMYHMAYNKISAFLLI